MDVPESILIPNLFGYNMRIFQVLQTNVEAHKKKVLRSVTAESQVVCGPEIE